MYIYLKVLLYIINNLKIYIQINYFKNFYFYYHIILIYVNIWRTINLREL